MTVQDLIEWFLERGGAQRLGAAAGLSAAVSERGLRAGLPHMLELLTGHAETAVGRKHMTDALAVIPDFPSVQLALSSGKGAEDLLRAGEAMKPTLLPKFEELVQRVVAESGGSANGVRRLLLMALPLALGWLRRTGVGAFIPALADVNFSRVGVAAGAAALGAVPGAADRVGVPVSVTPTAAHVVAEPERRYSFPWWLILPLPLLLLGGCWLLNLKKPEATVTGSPAVTTSAPVADGLVLTDPAENAEVSAGGFNISGTGTAGKTYQVFEDGTSIGTFTVGADGQWTVDVAGPSGGAHSYTIQDETGKVLATLPLQVKASATAATCTDNVTISMNDNETVTAPFRFGGRGSAAGYTVAVFNGDRRVGTKHLKLTPDCTWSYASNPGGRQGVVKVFRYEVRPTDAPADSDPLAKVTLNVGGSGTR